MSPPDGSPAEIAARIDALERICARDPSSARFVELGRLLLDVDRGRRAFTVLQRALDHQPDDLEGHLLLGEARLRLGQLGESIAEFEWVLDRDPDNIDALLLLARALEWDGRAMPARATLDRAMRAAPDDPRARQALRRLDEAGRGASADGSLSSDDDTAASRYDAFAPGLDSLDGNDEEPTAAMARDALVGPEDPPTAPSGELPFDRPFGAPAARPATPDDRGTLAQGSNAIMPRLASPLGDRSTLAQVSGGRRGPGGRSTIARGSPLDNRDTVAEDPPSADGPVARRPIDDRSTFRGMGRDAARDVPRDLAPTGPGVAGQSLLPGVISAGRGRVGATRELSAERLAAGPRPAAAQILEATRELRADDLAAGAAGLRGAEPEAPADDGRALQTDAKAQPAAPPTAARSEPAAASAPEAPPGVLEATRELRVDDLRRAGVAGDAQPTGDPSRPAPDAGPPVKATRELQADDLRRGAQAGPHGTKAIRRDGLVEPERPLHAHRRPRSTVDRAWLAVDPHDAQAEDQPTSPEGKRPHTMHIPRAERGAPEPAAEARPVPALGPPVAPAAPTDDRPTIERTPGESDPEPTGRFEKPTGRAGGEPAARRPAPGPATPARGGRMPARPAPSPAPRMPSPQPRGAPATPRGGAPAMPSPHPRGGPPAMPSPHPRGLPGGMPSPLPRGGPPAMPAPSPAPPAPAPAPPAPAMSAPAPPAPAPPAPAGPPPVYDTVPAPDPRAFDDDGLPPIPSIEPPPTRNPGPAVRGRSPWLRIGLLAMTVIVLLVALIATLRYRRAVDGLEAEVERIAEQIVDGNFGSRLDAAEALASPPDDPGLMARLGHFAAQLIGRPGFDRPQGDRFALRARVEAERLTLFGERSRQASAEETLRHARAMAPDRLDTAVAAALLALHGGDPAAADAAIEALPDDLQQSADADWIAALALRARGRFDAALERARRAAERDTDHPFAPTLVGGLQAESGDLAGGLDTLRVLLDQMQVSHVDTRISFERLRIRASKRAGEAVGNLEAVLEDRDIRLSPTQRARVHESIGIYHEDAGDLIEARAAYVRAMESDPIPDFMVRLARLDLHRFALPEARETAEKAAAAAPGETRWPVLLARADLAAGKAAEAEMRLESLGSMDVEGWLTLGRARLDLARGADGDRKASLLRGAEDAWRKADDRAGGLLDAAVGAALAVYLRTGEKDALDTLRSARTARDERPLRDRAWPFRAYGEALLGRGRTRAASAQFKSAVELDERDHRSWFGLCTAAAERLDSKGALKACRQVLAIDPWYDPAASLMARVAEAWRDAGAVIAALGPRLERGLDPVDARRLARALVEQDQLDKAEKIASDGTEDDATQRYVRGLVATARGQLGKARDLLYAAADQLSDDAWAQTAYARLLLKQDQPAQAAAYFRRAMSADDEPYAALGLAHAELDRGEPEAARLAAREAEKRAGRSLSHPRVRAEALAVQARALVARGGRRDLRLASRLIRKADGVEPDLAETLIAAGLLAEKQRKPERAAVRYRRLTQVAPKDPEGFYRLGKLLLDDAATRESAEAELKRASELDPEGVWGARARQLLQ